MVKFRSIFSVVVTAVENLVFAVSAICIIALAVLVSVEIIARNLGHSMIITEELCFIMLGWTAFLTAAYTFRKRGHISIDFFFDKLPLGARKVVYTITCLGIIVFLAFIAYKGYGIAGRQMLIPLTQSRLPRGLIFWGLPVGCVISIFFLVAEMIETFLFKNNATFITQEERQIAEIEAGRAAAAKMAKELMSEGEKERDGIL